MRLNLVKILAPVVVLCIAAGVIFGSKYYAGKKNMKSVQSEIKTGVYDATKQYAQGYVGTIVDLGNEDAVALAASVSEAASQYANKTLTLEDLEVICQKAQEALESSINARGIKLSPNERELLYEGIQAIVIETVGKAYNDNGGMSDDVVEQISADLEKRLGSLTKVMNTQTDSVYTDVVALEQLITTLEKDTNTKTSVINQLSADVDALRKKLASLEINDATAARESDGIITSITSIEAKLKKLESGDNVYLLNLANEIASLKTQKDVNGQLSSRDLESLKASLEQASTGLESVVQKHTTQIEDLNKQVSTMSSSLSKSISDVKATQAAATQLITKLQGDSSKSLDDIQTEFDQKLVNVVTTLTKSLDDNNASMKNKLDEKVAAMDQTLSDMNGELEQAKGEINTTLTSATQELSSALKSTTDKLNGDMTALTEDIENAKANMQSQFSEASANMQSELNDAKTTMQNNLDSALADMSSAVDDKLSKLNNTDTVLVGEVIDDNGVPTLKFTPKEIIIIDDGTTGP